MDSWTLDGGQVGMVWKIAFRFSKEVTFQVTFWGFIQKSWRFLWGFHCSCLLHPLYSRINLLSFQPGRVISSSTKGPPWICSFPVSMEDVFNKNINKWLGRNLKWFKSEKYSMFLFVSVFLILNELSKARRKRIHSTSASCQPARGPRHLWWYPKIKQHQQWSQIFHLCVPTL